MTAKKITSFDEFWPYYMGAHRHPLNRALHFVGTTCALGCAVTAVATGTPLLLLAVPVAGYGPAWIGHLLIEGNRPATFGYARYSLVGDFKMFGLALRGKLGAEIARLERERPPAGSAEQGNVAA